MDKELMEKNAAEIAEFKGRTRECGECWIWTGATNGKGVPKFKNQSARRYIWGLTRGELKPSTLLTPDCGCDKCVNPMHSSRTTKGEVSRLSNARPAVKLKRKMSLAAVKRPLGKIRDIEQANKIRASSKSGKQLAQELDVHPSLISAIRCGKAWVDFSSPMARMAA